MLRDQNPEYKQKVAATTKKWHSDNKLRLIAKNKGLTLEQYHALLEFQENCCGGCGKSFSASCGPNIDHDHACCPGKSSCGGCVRGLLCRSCNTTLGFVKDDENNLIALYDYLVGWKINSNERSTTSVVH